MDGQAHGLNELRDGLCALSSNSERLQFVVAHQLYVTNESDALEAPLYQQVERFLGDTLLVERLFEGNGLFGAACIAEDTRIALKLVVAQLVAIGQAHRFFRCERELDMASVHQLMTAQLPQLLAVESFYNRIGGIVGYHLEVVRLIAEQKMNSSQGTESGDVGISYHQPTPFNVEGGFKDASVRSAVWEALQRLGSVAEIYPVGGAGDRLGNMDKNGNPLPAACLQVLGCTLLDHLIQDVQAREHLHFMITGSQVTVPIGLMTSTEKDNMYHIKKMLEGRQYFGRPSDSIRCFTQPQCPVILVDGKWAVKGPMELTTKPGGHGVIWKLASDHGILNWFRTCGRSHVLVRQINNPISGADCSVLALAGFGFAGDKAFGFASCPRPVNVAEGTLVCLERQVAGDGRQEWEYGISNVEYTDFKKRGLQDAPVSEGSNVSKYPANTNCLFVNLTALSKALDVCTLPGMIVNLKSKFESFDDQGNVITLNGGRLETTMQNIADVIVYRSHEKVSALENLQQVMPTYMTFNLRRKQMMPTKNSYSTSAKSTAHTPLRTFCAHLENCAEIFSLYSNGSSGPFDVPNASSAGAPRVALSERLLSGSVSFLEYRVDDDDVLRVNRCPPFLFFYHPSLGPIYELIGGKIRNASFHRGAELRVGISTVDIDGLDLDGSFIVEGDGFNAMGHVDDNGVLVYSHRSAKLTVRNCKVRNDGYGFAHLNQVGEDADPDVFWRGSIPEQRGAVIVHFAGENCELDMQGVSLSGDHTFNVEANTLVTVRADKVSASGYSIVTTPITEPSWRWSYSVASDGNVTMERTQL